ncbi:MAG: SCO7613 C-terminal domain-containing membrane protein, partial [Microcella sp.]
GRSRTLRTAFPGPSAGRRAVDASTLVVTAILLVTAGATDGFWLALLVGAVVVLVVATSRDGLIGARSPRRHLGWVALALGTSALWTRLATDDVTAVEPYTLPLAGALLLVATAAALVGRRRATPSRSTAGLAGAALLVALVPSAVQSTGPDTQRALIAAAVSAVVLIGGMLASRRTAATLPGLAVAGAGAAAAALAVGALAHAVELATRANGDIDGIGAPLAGPALVHAALVVAVPAALAVVAEVLSRRLDRNDESDSARDDVPGSAATTASTEHRLRDGIVAALLGSGAISAAALALSGAVPEVETVSAPIALAALAVGALRLARTPSARSWPWLAPGLVLLLAPSLLAIDGAGEPLWRAVAIGAVAAIVFAVGLWQRLQAPFVLGGTALLIHLLVQSWPLLEQVGRAVEWWLWLGLAGVIVVALAARYERRLQNARDLARRISDLR